MTDPANGAPRLPEPNPFVGTWRLVSINSSESRLFGEAPVGMLMYDADGHVAVQIMRNPRPEFAANTMGFPSPKDVQIAYKGYYAYYGRYSVDTEKKIITHHLQGSLRPGDVGKDFVRAYMLSGKSLSLRPVNDSQAKDACLNWERA
ncbi:MAG: lipocalin-like domain-containing protein [Candidatus Acidiferrales bacterium]